MSKKGITDKQVEQVTDEISKLLKSLPLNYSLTVQGESVASFSGNIAIEPEGGIELIYLLDRGINEEIISEAEAVVLAAVAKRIAQRLEKMHSAPAPGTDGDVTIH